MPDRWDLGAAAEYRIIGNFWLMVAASVGGLRGLRMTDGEWHQPQFDIGESPYISLGINYRPALLQ